MRLLLIDDDEPLMEALATHLVRQRYAVDIATDGEVGWEYITLFTYDLVVLDVMLPKLDGISFCQRLRSEGYDMPVLMLTAREEGADKVKGLDAGADDYVVKPFDLEELNARIRALLRRESHILPPVLQWGGLSLHPDTCKVTYEDCPLHPTPKEYALLELLLRNSSRVFSLDAIIESLWSFEDPPSEDAVRTHIKGLRQKLKAAGAPKDLVETVYGLGYRLKPLESLASHQATTATTSKPEPSSRVSDASAAMAQVWGQFKGAMQERVNALQESAIALQEGNWTLERQQQARSVAHKLVGALGSFGFPEGSNRARELEQLLQRESLLGTDQAPQVNQLVQALQAELTAVSSDQAVDAAIAGGPFLLIVSPDRSWSEQLQAEASAAGMRTAIALTPTEAKAQIQQQRPNVVVLNRADPVSSEISPTAFNGLKILAQLHQQIPSVPILVVMGEAGFSDRLEAVRQGAHTILQQPLTPQHAIVTVTRILQSTMMRARLMIVDDDPQVLAALRMALASWGFELTTLEDLTQFWSTLEKTAPDLLVLDVEMPQVTGLELCQVLRADPRWKQLPVLFLTVHEDAATQQQVFSVGADDFVSKSSAVSELAARILNRLERLRALDGKRSS